MRSRSRWYSERVGDGRSATARPTLSEARAAYGERERSRSARRAAMASATRAGSLVALSAVAEM